MAFSIHFEIIGLL